MSTALETVLLTRAEIRAALEALGQMTAGNARSFDEWRSQTHGTHAEWRALLRAERKLIVALGKRAA